MIRGFHPVSGSWLLTHPGSRIQGTKKAPDPRSRIWICNTALSHLLYRLRCLTTYLCLASEHAWLTVCSIKSSAIWSSISSTSSSSCSEGSTSRTSSASLSMTLVMYGASSNILVVFCVLCAIKQPTIVTSLKHERGPAHSTQHMKINTFELYHRERI
jgi:hypothetical protein